MRPPALPVVLASASPRRKELLGQWGWPFAVVPSAVDEDALTDPDPWITARRLAREKALAVFAQQSESLVIGADTVVALPDGDGWIQLAKPVDVADAVRMLTTLQNNTHTVITGVCLKWSGGLSSFTEESRVTFRAVSPEEIERYVATGEPMDKAGAYGLQGMAKQFVARVEGSVTNVIGLPMERLEEAVREMSKA